MSTTTTNRPTHAPRQKTGDDTGAGSPRALTADDLQVTRTDTALEDAPTLSPPGTAAVAAVAAIGTWQADKRINALWANASVRNAYMHVDGIGWRRLHPGTDSSWNALVALASQARQTGCRIDYRDEADGLVHEIALW